MQTTRWLAPALLGAMLWAAPAMAQEPIQREFDALLEGDQEVPPVDTRARGQTTLRFRVGSVLSWRVVVRGIEDMTRAHIHCAPVGEPGPIGVTLVELAQPALIRRIEGRVFGPDPENDCGWETLGDVHAAIVAGEAYVNVHSETFPAGEIRGQLTPPL